MNTFLEPVWNRHCIESVQITMAEKFDVEGRKAGYEKSGAILDVIQEVVGFLAIWAMVEFSEFVKKKCESTVTFV